MIKNLPARKGAASFRSKAWLLRGISAIPGELRLSSGRISFTATGPGSAWDWQLRKLERNARTVKFASFLKSGRSAMLFDAGLGDLQILFPWYYFSGGLVVRIGAEKYRISFGRPANSAEAGSYAGIARAGAELQEVGSMRKTGKSWRKILLGSGNAALEKDA